MTRSLGFHRHRGRMRRRDGRRAPAEGAIWRPRASGGERLTAFEVPDTAMVVRARLLANADDLDALFVLAALRAQNGLVEEGISILDRVLDRDPAYPGGWRFKATLHHMRGEDDAERSAWARAEDVEG